MQKLSRLLRSLVLCHYHVAQRGIRFAHQHCLRDTHARKECSTALTCDRQEWHFSSESLIVRRRSFV